MAEGPPHFSSTRGKISLEHTLLTVFVFLTANIIAFGYINFKNYEKHYRDDIGLELAAIADLKSGEISQYIKERVGDGSMLFRRGAFYDAVRRFFESPEDEKNKEYLSKWLDRYARHFQYDGISVVDTKGVTRISIPKARDKLYCPITQKRLSEILHTDSVQLGDFCRSEYNNRIYLSILVPIRGEDKDSYPLGVLILHIDPQIYLYPFIEKWPIPSKTSETLLVRRDGDDVLFLNELRFRKDTALSLRFPIKQNKDLPAVKAVLGKTGVVEGKDCRGVPVVAYMRAVADTPWFLVARIDTSEAYGPMLRQLWYIVCLTISLAIVVGVVIWFIWRRHNLIFYRAQYLSAEALKASEERYRRLFEASKDGVLLVDVDTGTIEQANKYLIDLIGYSKADILHKHLWDIGVFKDIITSKENFLELQTRGYVRYENLPLKAHDGRIVEVEFISNVYSAGGKKIVQCNIRDNTEHKRMQNELAQAKETQFKTLMESLPQKVFLKDRSSVYISCNSNYAKDLKIKPEEISGRTDHEFFPTYLAEKYREDDKRVMWSGKTENIEEEFVVIRDFLRGAQRTIINTVKVPIRDKNGNVTGLFGLFWDITERKNAENALRNLNQQIEFILGATKTGLDIIDSEFKLVYVDPEWQKIYGDPSGKKCYEYFMGMKEKCRGCGAAEALETKKPAVTEEILKGEGNRCVQVTSIPYQDNEGNWLVAEVNVDITERKRLEKRLRETETLKVAAEIKSKFTSMVSHELRSPMAVIKESINLVLEGLAGGVTPEQKDILDTAKNNIDRLGRLINNVLDFQKMEAGKMELDIKEHDLNDVVLATSKEMNILAQEKGLSFAVNVDESIPRTRFDKDRIIQVITNLLSNAVKFTEKGSISVSTLREDNVVHVMVEDTGPGIQSEDIPKLFHAFEQLGGGIGKKRGGTGLGLAISKDIIHAHNGKIWVESQFGKGSIFHFALPIKERRW
jgi:two-component system sensor histidine kinase/response regulator